MSRTPDPSGTAAGVVRAAKIPRRVWIVAALSVVYLASMFYRVSNAVIAPDLMRELGLSAEAISVLTGAFFLAFAAALIPAGILFDRFGPRRTIAATMLLAVAGSALFAASDGLAALTIGRLLMGAGSASVLSGSMVIVSRWFPLDRYATLGGIVLAAGGIGSILATTPLAFVADRIGWRAAFYGMAAVTAGLSLLCYAVARDAPADHPFHRRPRQSLGTVIGGMREVLTNPGVPYIFTINLVTYATVMCIAALWGGPYLHDVHHLDGIARGNVLLFMAAALVLGPLIYGPLDRLLDTRKWLVVGGATIKISLVAILAITPTLAVWQVTVLFTLIALVGGYGVVIMAHGRAQFPLRLIGRGITTINVAVFLGVALMQVVTGLIIGAFIDQPGEPAPNLAYRVMFGFLGLVEFLALQVYLRQPDAKPSRDSEIAAK